MSAAVFKLHDVPYVVSLTRDTRSGDGKKT